jgi:hypothetical protein
MRTTTTLAAVMCFAPVIASAVCPTPGVVYGWPFGIPAYYTWANFNGPAAWTNLGVGNLGIESPIHDAFSSWSSANQSQNSSNVTFYYSGTGFVRVYAVQVNFPGIPGMGDPGGAARYTMALWAGTNSVLLHDVTIYIGATYYIGATPPFTPVFDQGAADYHTFIKKVMLHEIGHAMYLTDQPGPACGGQVAGQSVMNGSCGTNDVANFLPTSVQACDNATIH